MSYHSRHPANAIGTPFNGWLAVAFLPHPSANGKPSAFQAEYPGSNPVGCSISANGG
jgi:hypothetical protein